MNEYQQALMRIIELEDKNAEMGEMLNELIDSHYGMATHHIGDGDGIPDEMAEKIRIYWADRVKGE